MRPPVLYVPNDNKTHARLASLLADLQNGGPAYEYQAAVLSAVLNADASVRTFDLALKIHREEGFVEEKLFDVACNQIERVLDGHEFEFAIAPNRKACDSGFAQDFEVAVGV